MLVVVLKLILKLNHKRFMIPNTVDITQEVVQHTYIHTQVM